VRTRSTEGAQPSLTVSDLLADAAGYRLDLELLAGAGGVEREIRVPRIQKPGLALAGYVDQIRSHRVQILGATELAYLATLDPATAQANVARVFEAGAACFVVTKGLEPPDYVAGHADRTHTPLLRTTLRSSVFIDRIDRFLADRLAPRIRIHGVLIDVMEVGILLRGESGIGKSECALDLIRRGHRLVADDVVEIRRYAPFRLVGTGLDLIRYHIEIRGIGILDIRELFGITSVRDEKEVELAVELVPWREGEVYERLGLEERTQPILGVEVPYLRIPVAPGRSIASVVEVAARNHLLRRMGHHSAIRLAERLDAALREEP